VIQQNSQPEPSPIEESRQITADANKIAVATVVDMNLPSAIHLKGEFDSLGPHVGQKGRKVFAGLLDEQKDALPFLFGVAVREMWFAAWSAAHFMRIYSDRGDPSSAELWSATGYAERNGGFSYTLYNELGNISAAPERAELLAGTPFSESPSQSSLLKALGLYWLDAANDLAARQQFPEAFDSLHEGYEALSLISEANMWDAGFKIGKEDGADDAKALARSALGRTAALARHAENRAMKQDVFRWCDEHLSGSLSMDAAASRIAGSVVPAAWRTVRDWIGEWKKLRAAGTP
jgi:hypothetical protein